MHELPDEQIAQDTWDVFDETGEMVTYAVWVDEQDWIEVEVFEGFFIPLSLWVGFDPGREWEDQDEPTLRVEYTFDRRFTDDQDLTQAKIDWTDLLKEFCNYLKERPWRQESGNQTGKTESSQETTS